MNPSGAFDKPVNYLGPDESVECAYDGCSNRLRRSDFDVPQFCSKEHRDGDQAVAEMSTPWHRIVRRVMWARRRGFKIKVLVEIDGTWMWGGWRR